MQTEYLTFIADFKVQGRFAYLSHQETLSFWQRVLVRAHVPLVYSSGFNPRPRLSLPLPRSVGVESECERLCTLVIAEGFCESITRNAIGSLLPDYCTLFNTETAFGKVSYYPVSATYQFTLISPPDAARREHLNDCIQHIDSNEPITLLRRMDKAHQRPIDIRPFVEGLTLDGAIIRAVCAIRPSGSVRIEELMHWLRLGPHDLVESVRRVAVQWATNTQHFQGENNLS